MYRHERSLVKQLADKPFVLIGVNSDQGISGKNLQQLRETIKKKNLTWRSFQNENGKDGVISEQWDIQGWPTLYILDENGVIRWIGSSDARRIDAVITECLAEMGHEVELTNIDDQKDHENDDESDSMAADG